MRLKPNIIPQPQGGKISLKLKVQPKPKLAPKALFETNYAYNPIVIDPIKRAMHRQRLEIGDQADNFVFELMKQSDSFTDVKKMTHCGGKYDIIYKDKNGTLRGLNVKALNNNKQRPHIWMMHLTTKYNPSTLIVGVNQQRTRFCLIPYKECAGNQSLAMSFASKDTKYEDYKFDDLASFTTELYERAQNSVILTDHNDGLSVSKRQEVSSLGKIEAMCERLGFSYERNETLYSSVDIYINDYNIQCKSTAQKHRQQYNITLIKKIQGKMTPYSVEDGIDFFIFQIATDDYVNDICVIPVKELIDRGFLKTDKDAGKVIISIPPPRHKKAHWINPYWNNFDQLKR